MAKARSLHRCHECGASSPQWVGRCPGCGAWNTLEEEVAPVGPQPSAPVGRVEAAVPIADVAVEGSTPTSTGIGEVDRVLGGGLVPGSVTLLGGEPGIGKSTLLLQLASDVAVRGAPVLYASAEESKAQVRARAERIGALRPRLLLATETALPNLVAHFDAVSPGLAVVDSIQTVFDPTVGSTPGSVAQVRACAGRLVQEAKERSMALVLVGHVTKDGDLAGPRALEHLVDTVLAFEGDRHHALRLLRAPKHRFGPTDELGVLEMTEGGLRGVDDPSGLFLADRTGGVPGSVVLPTIEGHRPLLVEVQALVSGDDVPTPRRSSGGLDHARMAQLLAVLQERSGVGLARSDVYASVVGGVRVTEPGADLALALAVASAARGEPLPDDLVAFGEVGLGGELRQVQHGARRLAEAARVGFTRAVGPLLSPDPPAGLELARARTLAEALRAVGLGP